MLETIIYCLIWCFAVYGVMIMLQEIIHQSIYKKNEDNINIIMTVKNVEDGIESYIREFKYYDKFNNNLIVIDLESDDETMCILKELEKENINLKVFDKISGEEFLKAQLT